MLILGLNAYHGDAAACLVRDGKIVAAIEEERLRRVKHWSGFPSLAISACLARISATISDVDHVAVNSDPTANFLAKAWHVARTRPGRALLGDRIVNAGRRLSIRHQLDRLEKGTSFRGRIHRVEHHIAHLASAFLVSPFDEGIVLSVDGFGDFASAAWGIGRGAEINVAGRLIFPHSLGIFYQAMTQFLGFPNYGDEYKIMGLAPYGRPRFEAEMDAILQQRRDGTFALNLDFFRHHREPVDETNRDGAPKFATLFSPALEALLGPARRSGRELDQHHLDLAASVQAAYEQALFRLVGALYERHRLENLALAGGCAMNAAANGRLRQETSIRHLYLPPAPGDAGGAVGAALHVWHQFGHPRSGRPMAADLGPSFDDEAIEAALGSAPFEAHRIGDTKELCRIVAESIVRGEVVGWFQGAMEFGPRALGNRSLLADPRRADMKDILNHKIKRRESFRPFAPSVLAEHAAEWFDVGVAEILFMGETRPVRADKRALIPAVTHVNGSSRLQTVTRSANQRFWQLISAFHAITGVPMVLNTSFNENEPIVCTPGEALDCFRRTNMDALVLGDWLIRRQPDPALDVAGAQSQIVAEN